jgi:RNA polymerase sigma-70 factor (ECF subfamily)
MALLLPFLAAAHDGDAESLERMLAPNAVLYADGVEAPGPVADYMIDAADEQFFHGPLQLELATVDGRPGRLLRAPDGHVWEALSIDGADHRIQAIHIVRDRGTLAHLAA